MTLRREVEDPTDAISASSLRQFFLGLAEPSGVDVPFDPMRLGAAELCGDSIGDSCENSASRLDSTPEGGLPESGCSGEICLPILPLNWDKLLGDGALF
jgi:hypothetical protein